MEIMEIAKFVILKSSGVTQIWLLCSNKHIIMYFSSFLYHKTYCEHIYIDLSGLLNVYNSLPQVSVPLTGCCT